MCLCARSNLAILLLEVILNGFYGGFVLFLGLISNSVLFSFLFDSPIYIFACLMSCYLIPLDEINKSTIE